MLWPIAHAALELLTDAELHRVKRCAGCPWLFLDHSKNTSRRWCAMNDCGTHAKVRRYVARRAALRTSSQKGPGNEQHAQSAATSRGQYRLARDREGGSQTITGRPPPQPLESARARSCARSCLASSRTCAS
jgi:hypothetical protein